MGLTFFESKRFLCQNICKCGFTFLDYHSQRSIDLKIVLYDIFFILLHLYMNDTLIKAYVSKLDLSTPLKFDQFI